MPPQGPPPPFDIPLGRGLQEGIDPKLLPLGNAARLVNYEVARTAAFTKRRGWNGVLDPTGPGGTLSPVKLFSQGDALHAVSEETSDSLQHLYAYSSGRDRWSDYDTVTPCATSRRPLVRLTTGIAAASMVTFGAGDALFELITYVREVSGTYASYYRIVDARTGAIVVKETALGDFNALAVTVDTDAWIVYSSTVSGLKATKFSAASPTVPTTTITLDATGTLYLFDVDKFTLGEFVVAYQKATAPTVINVATVNNAGTAVSHSTTETAASGVDALSIAAKQGSGVHVAWAENNDVWLARWNDTLGAQTLAATAVDNTPVTALSVGVEVTAGGDSVVGYYGTLTASQHETVFRLVGAGGALGSRRHLYRCRLAAAPRRIGSRIYALCAVPQQVIPDASLGNLTGISHLALFCVDEVDSAEPPLLLGHPVTFACQGGTGGKIWPVDSDGTRWTFGAAVLVRSQLQLDTAAKTPTYSYSEEYGMDRLEFDLRPQAALYHHAYAAPSLLVGGGLVHNGDSAQLVENGFLQAPTLTETHAAGTGPISAASPGNTYQYVARYEWYDDAGLTHVGPWSNALMVTLTDAVPANYNVAITATCTSATRRGRTAAGADRDARIAIYRSTANGASGTGDVVYYRVASHTDSAQNDRGAWSTMFVDTLDDDALLASGLGQVTFPVDVLAPVCPPASAGLVVHRGRAWLLSAEDRREVWPSRLLVASEAPAFCPELVLRASDSPSELVALLPVDDKMVLLAEDRIYYVAGDGPDDTGQAGAFGGPWLVTSQHGCTDARSLVQTPLGGLFLSAAGFVQLDRALNVSLVGDPVQETVEVYSTCLASHHDGARNRAVWLMANADSETKLLAYDYEHEVWSILDTDATPGAACMALWGTRMVLAWDSTIRQEGGGANPGWDWSGDLANTWVTGVYETPWICPGGVGAYQRVRAVFFVGYALSHCRVQIDVYLNFDDATPAQTKTVDLSSTAQVAGLPLVLYELPMEKQACQALKVRITDLAPVDDVPGSEERAGLALTRISLDLENERGFPRLDPKNRGGS